MRKSTVLVSQFLIVLAAESFSQVNQTHPRLWIRRQDLPVLKAKASITNPYYAALHEFAESLKVEADGNDFEDQFNPGSYSEYSEYPAESTAMFFAFMSLITEGAESTDYADRAHAILMRIIDAAVLGQADDEPFRDPSYSVFDRSRWYMFAVPLTVDWIYQTLSIEDKAKIRTVFLRWCDENTHANTTTHNHPQPFEPGDKHPVKLDDQLLQNQSSDDRSRHRIRYASNNYYLAHLRNIYLMAASLNDEDDANGELHEYIDDVTGAWLYVTEEYMKNEGLGGMSAEGFLYGPSAFGRLAQALLAIYTSGEATPEIPMRGTRSTFDMQFWDDFIPGLLNSLSPRKTLEHPWSFDGSLYLPFNYGDIQRFKVDDYIELLGPLAWYDMLSGNNPSRLNASKWIQMHVPQGGLEHIADRIGYSDGSFEQGIFYFLMLDPMDAPADPRPQIPTTWYAEGIGRILSRTDWSEDATAMSFKCGFNRIDHQFGDGLSFSFYRKGYFLTAPLSGYGYDMAVSSTQNTLSLENNNTGATSGPRLTAFNYGSQWFLSAEGEGIITDFIDNANFLFVTGDATGLYTYINPWVSPTGDDIIHASRSMVWIKPDIMVVYDRATSSTESRYKRFWLGLPAAPAVTAKQATVQIDGDQYLRISSILPVNGVMSAKPYSHEADVDGFDEPAENDPMAARLMVEDPASPSDVRFLHVLQGRDNNSEHFVTASIESSNGAYQGTIVGDVAILFKKDIGASFETFSFYVPSGTNSFLVSGLFPNTNYNLSIDNSGSTTLVTVTEGGSTVTNSAGMLVLGEIQPQGNVTSTGDEPQTITVHPNPASSAIAVTTESPIQKLMMIDTQGKICLSAKGSGASNQRLYVEHLARGLYVLRIFTMGGIVTRKITIN